MPSLDEIARAHTDLDADDLAWLHRLIADWQIVADLSFADLVLWLPDHEGRGFWAGAQQRPTTGPTALLDDVAGTFIPRGRRPMIDQAYADGRLVREGDRANIYNVPVRVEAIPVRRSERVLAVLARTTNQLGVRMPSQLELTYLQTAADLTKMITQGLFPASGQRSDHADTPRVGDGFMRLDANGRVTYASPNALSVYRAMGLTGDLVGKQLAELTRQLVPPKFREDEETLSAVLSGQVARDTELATDSLALVLRSLPLRPAGELVGGVILLRDITDLRRRDRELVTKDATIREIHHRVKNNLQTVAALLRLQARRVGHPDARSALEEAVRRVGSIAVVHETLSHTDEEHVAFDEIADRLGRMVTDVGGLGDAVMVRREGTFGVLVSDVATPLAMVLTEVLQNSVEHGYGAKAESGGVGQIRVEARSLVGRLHVTIEDDGVGLPEDFDPEGSGSLGLSIVRTLVESELGGQLSLGPAHSPLTSGTRVEIDVPLA